ncbi:pig-Q [Rhizina undulata]
MGSNGLMRIFWPSDLPHSDRLGVLVGWRNSKLDLFVVAVLNDVDSRRIENELRTGSLYRKSLHSVERIFELCGGSSLHVLGTVNGPPGRLFEPEHVQAFTQKGCRYPQILFPKASGITLQVIMFDRPYPRQMQYLSLTPISLALEDQVAASAGEDGDSAEEERERTRKAALVEKLKLHSVTRPARTEKEQSLQMIIDQVNCSYEMMMLLKENVSLINSRRSRRSLSVSEMVMESATSLWRTILRLMVQTAKFLWPWVTKFFVIVILITRFFAEMILRVLEWRLRPELAALKDISATAQQFDIRLQQFCYWPIQYVTLRKRKEDWESVTTSHPDYIRFYNSLWLVANDVIIGIALGSYIIENAHVVAYWIDHYLRAYTVEGMKGMISWLMERPGGLKLNDELGIFLGDLFLWVIDYWADTMTSIRPHLPQVIFAIGYSSFVGASMPIALFSDLLSILTLHIYSFYIASARIYNWQLTIIISLFHLFRGKKRNVLRNRIDSCDYDLDQLLVGTILFTLLIFLLPTVLVFYLTFAGARMAIILGKATLETLLACLNHFPLFALMLRVKDSKRLPGGIRFELVDDVVTRFKVPREVPVISYIHLKSTPLPFNAMFHQYFQLGNRIRNHYVSPRVILCLVTGRFVPPIHRKNLYSMQYSMLPTKRAGMRELWSRLTAGPASSCKERRR